VSRIACLAILFAALAGGVLPASHWTADPAVVWQSAQAQNRPVLAFVTRPGCRHCVLMRGAVFADADINRYLAQNYVCWNVDTARQAAPEAWRITQYPTTLLLSPQGRILWRGEGQQTRDTFLRQLHAASATAAKVQQPARR